MPAKSKKTSRKAPKSKSTPAKADLRDFCRTLPGTTEDIKWGDDLVFSVGKKMYACFDLENPHEIGFKCDEDEFDALTEMPGIIPAPYAAKYGWVKITKRGALSPTKLKALITKSHVLVASCLPKKTQAKLGLL
ncbi:MAG: MmcQ/YjbR family DNA-binding protein [Phycisphaerales bacterium]